MYKIIWESPKEITSEHVNWEIGLISDAKSPHLVPQPINNSEALLVPATRYPTDWAIVYRIVIRIRGETLVRAFSVTGMFSSFPSTVVIFETSIWWISSSNAFSILTTV